MEKPNEILMKLCGLGWIHGLHIAQRQTGTDTAETFVKITGSNGKADGKWCSYREYLELVPGHNSVCHVKEKYVRQVEDWGEFKKQNAKELAEYKRLKDKFGDV